VGEALPAQTNPCELLSTIAFLPRHCVVSFLDVRKIHSANESLYFKIPKRKITPLASAALADPTTRINKLAKSLNMARVTLYRYLNGDGSLKESGQRLMDRAG